MSCNVRGLVPQRIALRQSFVPVKAITCEKDRTRKNRWLCFLNWTVSKQTNFSFMRISYVMSNRDKEKSNLMQKFESGEWLVIS